jgi:sec-independent protein translocase protein TatA
MGFSPGPFELTIIGMFSPGPFELMIIGIIALLLFGKRLPEVARSLGKGIVEFKKGVRGIEDEVDSSVHRREPARRPEPHTDTQDVTAPKFEPPTSAPVSASSSSERDEQA